jgi:hypothetical protein
MTIKNITIEDINGKVLTKNDLDVNKEAWLAICLSTDNLNSIKVVVSNAPHEYENKKDFIIDLYEEESEKGFLKKSSMVELWNDAKKMKVLDKDIDSFSIGGYVNYEKSTKKNINDFVGPNIFLVRVYPDTKDLDNKILKINKEMNDLILEANSLANDDNDYRKDPNSYYGVNASDFSSIKRKI